VLEWFYRAFGVPASNLAFAGSTVVAPVEGSVHGQRFAPKNAGFDVR
jgi:hypothetical protein